MSGQLGPAQRVAGVDHHPHHAARPGEPRRGRRHRRRHRHADRRGDPAGRPTPTTTWRCSTGPPDRPWICSAPGGCSPAQRIMLIARDGGCTKPGCTVGAYGSQVHHVVADWADGGNTNIDELGLACGPDNRMVGEHGGWTTTINARGDVEWIPPPTTGHRPSPSQLLPPPRTTPAPTRRRTRDGPESENDTV